MPESQLRSVVIHELAHIRRGDFLAKLLASVAILLYWPDPLFCLRLQVLEPKMVPCGEFSEGSEFRIKLRVGSVYKRAVNFVSAVQGRSNDGR